MGKKIELCGVKNYIAVEDLQFYPNNPRKISEVRLEQMKKSIVQKGFYEPILVWSKDNIILAGNHRTKAVLELIAEGYEFDSPDGKKKGVLPVVIEDVSDEVAEEILFETNNHYAEWVEDKLQAALTEAQQAGRNIEGFGFTAEEVDLLVIKAIEEAKTTTVAEHERTVGEAGDDDDLPAKASTEVKIGEIWELGGLGGHRIMCGSSLNEKDVERLFDNSMAELCFTSPSDVDQHEDLLAAFIPVCREYARLIAVNLGITRKAGEIAPYWDGYITAAKNCGLKLLSWNVWNQGFCGSVGKLTAMFPIAHEFIFVFGEKTKKLNPTIDNDKGDALVREKRELGTVVDCPPYLQRNEEIAHPAIFPVALPVAYIEACTDEGETVYEPFCGSGSTLIACEKTQRRCLAMEIEPSYCGITIDRWERFTNKKAVRIHPTTTLKKKKK